jgi:hypothetical protein
VNCGLAMPHTPRAVIACVGLPSPGYATVKPGTDPSAVVLKQPPMSALTPPPRRRFKRRYVVGLALLLLIAAPFVWRFRPLNDVESRLIGDWRLGGAERTIRLTRGRRGYPFENGKVEDKFRWSCRADGYRIAYDGEWRSRLENLANRVFTGISIVDEPIPVTFLDVDTIEVEGDTFHRIPTP